MSLLSLPLPPRKTPPTVALAAPESGPRPGVNAAAAPMPAQDPGLRLVSWAPSPRGRLLLAMLEFKRLAFRLAADPAATPCPDHHGPEVAAGLLVDGRLLCSLSELAWALERLAPQRPLLPQAPAMRALCLALAEWADDSLQPLTLYYQWLDPAGERQRGRDFSSSDAGQRALSRRRRQVRAYLVARGLSGRPEAQVRAELQRQLHTVDALLHGRRHLFGSAPTLADFAVASQLAALAAAPGSTGCVAERPTLADYLERCWSPAGQAPVVTQGSFPNAS